MCDDCLPDTPNRDLLDLDPQELRRTAERIEKSSAGQVAPDAAWAIFWGARSGSLPYAVLARLAESRLAAIELMTQRKRRAPLKCHPEPAFSHRVAEDVHELLT
jgi:hypothetical protein